MQIELQLGEQGIITIPQQLRQILGFFPKEKLIAKDDNGRLIIEKESIIKQRLRNKFAKIPAGIDLAQELISDRKQEAQREMNKT
jgi:bifunctional DNA-binding transcriptional regulator/antitoxin component of YhaV-PrlF toxin-antitoxin module